MREIENQIPTHTIRVILEAQGYFTNLPETVKCQCGECFTMPEDILTYECELCKRTVPYCFGCDDDLFEYCDACAVATWKVTGQWE
jgi:hypothetical protein